MWRFAAIGCFAGCGLDYGLAGKADWNAEGATADFEPESAFYYGPVDNGGQDGFVVVIANIEDACGAFTDDLARFEALWDAEGGDAVEQAGNDYVDAYRDAFPEDLWTAFIYLNRGEDDIEGTMDGIAWGGDSTAAGDFAMYVSHATTWPTFSSEDNGTFVSWSFEREVENFSSDGGSLDVTSYKPEKSLKASVEVDVKDDATGDDAGSVRASWKAEACPEYHEAYEDVYVAN